MDTACRYANLLGEGGPVELKADAPGEPSLLYADAAEAEKSLVGRVTAIVVPG